MDQLKKIHRCYHCGAVLQVEYPSEPGYITEKIMETYPEGFLLCDSCYRKEKFSSAAPEVTFDQQYLSILHKAKETDSLILYVVDLLSFEGSLIPDVLQELKNQNVIVIANKRDLLPKNFSDQRLSEYVHERLTQQYNINVINVVLASATNLYNIDKLNDLILQHGKNRDIYVIGAATSGKSAIIAALLKEFKNNTDKVIATTRFKGTDLKVLRIPITNKYYLYETPGTSVENSILSKVEKSVQNALTPRKAIQPKKFILYKNNSVFIGEICCIELLSKERTTIEVFCSEKVQYQIRRHKAYEKFSESIIKEQLSPASNRFTDIKDFDIYDLEIAENDKKDIGISGLGWFTFNGNNQKFRIYVPKGVYVYISRSKVEYANK